MSNIKSSTSGLAKVQNLYVMQVELWNLLDSDLSDPERRKEAKRCMKEFSDLLNQVDWRYMGGEDVYETLQKIMTQVNAKISRQSGGKTITRRTKAPSVKAAAKPAKKSAKKAVKKPAKKAPAKKAPAQKKKPTPAKKSGKKVPAKKKPAPKKVVKKKK